MTTFDARPYDVVLFGATGFTGKLVAEYLCEHAEDAGVKWAIAGRNKEKLEAVRDSLMKRDESMIDLPILVADAHDTVALSKLVPETRVVCTTVGPYSKYGRDLTRACAKYGTSYCDLTGEPNFVRAVVDECHQEAKKTKARIVHCAGYDSIPSDLGTFMAWDYARRTHKEDLAWCKVFTGRTRGKASGGTIATMLTILEAAKADRETRRLLLDPHGLDPERGKAPKDPFEDDQRSVRFDKDLGRWTAPFVMASINARIVRRSHALFREEHPNGSSSPSATAANGDDSHGYGSRFRYNEAMSFPIGPKGFITASMITAGIGGLFAAAAVPVGRSLLEKFVLPAPGEGPTREEIETGFFEMIVLAKTESGKRLKGRVAGTKDPGYGETAKMIAETAMGLAKDGVRLGSRYGVLTPATAMGLRLIERLRDAGMTFDIHDA
jgi:short subunit dehydrogenase-like uncharacterized protein